MAAATAYEIKEAVAAMIKVGITEMADYWDAHAAKAAIFASAEVTGRLLRRGFTTDDIANFDRLNEITLDIGQWRAIMLGGLYNSFDATVIAALDRRAECDTILVYADGEWIQPPSGNAGTTVTGGPMAQDPNGVFDWAPDRPGYGIEW